MRLGFYLKSELRGKKEMKQPSHLDCATDHLSILYNLHPRKLKNSGISNGKGGGYSRSIKIIVQGPVFTWGGRVEVLRRMARDPRVDSIP